MSIHYISQAWKTSVSDYRAKLVLLKLADNASDEGIAWPHIDTIASETGLSRRTVFRALDRLESDGIIERNRGRNEVIYQIKKCQSDTCRSVSVTPLEVEKCQRDTSRSVTVTPALYIRTVNRTNIGETNNDEQTQKRFKKPSVADVLAYGSSLTPKFLKAQQFIDYYESKGWVVGKAPMKCWKSAVRTWQAREKQTTRPQTSDQFGI
jgi:DNA-binding transcriptional regulator YhcF (GntR family)